jgi:ABC-type transporter Mla maintaining outer membrane lipid asymmetry ATPase subunit MlaF
MSSVGRQARPAGYVIEAREVRCAFGQIPTLDGANHTVTRGEILAIMGPA